MQFSLAEKRAMELVTTVRWPPRRGTQRPVAFSTPKSPNYGNTLTPPLSPPDRAPPASSLRSALNILERSRHPQTEVPNKGSSSRRAAWRIREPVEFARSRAGSDATPPNLVESGWESVIGREWGCRRRWRWRYQRRRGRRRPGCLRGSGGGSSRRGRPAVARRRRSRRSRPSSATPTSGGRWAALSHRMASEFFRRVFPFGLDSSVDWVICALQVKFVFGW